MIKNPTSLNTLFLCTGNSARSILAESLLNRLGKGRHHAWSAGSHPTGTINPRAINLLEKLNYKVEHLRSKSWDEFSIQGAPKFDIVITVCDNAANEFCPIWPGNPLKAHWSLSDPARDFGNEIRNEMAFARTYERLERLISGLLDLTVSGLDGVNAGDEISSLAHKIK